MASTPNNTQLVIDYKDLRVTPADRYGLGASLRIEDLRNAEFVSDGVSWRPRGGRQTLYHRQGSLVSPVATMTGNGAAQAFTMPETLIIPAGLIKQHMKVFVEAIIKRGGATGAGMTTVACLGTTNTMSDQSLVGQTIAQVDGNEARFFGAAQFFPGSTTSFLSMGSLVPQSTTTAQQIIKNVNVNTARDMYVSMGCSNTSFVNPDTMNLISYHIWIEG